MSLPKKLPFLAGDIVEAIDSPCFEFCEFIFDAEPAKSFVDGGKTVYVPQGDRMTVLEVREGSFCIRGVDDTDLHILVQHPTLGQLCLPMKNVSKVMSV